MCEWCWWASGGVSLPSEIRLPTLDFFRTKRELALQVCRARLSAPGTFGYHQPQTHPTSNHPPVFLMKRILPLLLLLLATPAARAQAPAKPAIVQFNRDIRPILASR